MTRVVSWFGLVLSVVGLLVEVLQRDPSKVDIAAFLVVAVACGMWLHDHPVKRPDVESEIAEIRDDRWRG